jgi:DNA (cytosine-5)-methyltransferase 1
LKLASFFAGAGGLDLGFTKAGFNVVWANEYDKNIWATYERNSPGVKLNRLSITEVQPHDIPRVDGMIGGPPCQSWSEAGMARGIEDHRGQLFFEYLRLIEEKKPDFFLAENVSGILFSKHNNALDRILGRFCALGYNVSYGLLNANDFGVPQDRERVIIVGYKTSFGSFFIPPQLDRSSQNKTLKDAIWDLRKTAKVAKNGTYANPDLKIPNHEYLEGTYSSMYMSRNRVRAWDQPSFTIQAGGRHCPIHPQAPAMKLVDKDVRIFEPGYEKLYRRLTVREAARIQTFPDEFVFEYSNVLDGYKMIGNAVPIEFARQLAQKIKSDFSTNSRKSNGVTKAGEIASFRELGWSPDFDLMSSVNKSA